MKILNQDECLIFVVDIQEKLINAVFNRETLAKKSEILAKASRILDIPVVLTEQYPQGLGTTIPQIKSVLSDDAKFYEKTAFNALLDETLCGDLKTLNRNQVIVIGIETHICVHQTVQALVELNYDVTVVSDCCGSRSESEYLSALDYFKTNGVDVKTTEMLLFELLKGAKHPNFKEIQTMIK